MKIKSISMVLMVITLTALSVSSHAETVRGRLDYQSQYGTYPAADVPVTLYDGYSRLRSYASYTDYRGMYYFYGIRPGNYTLEIWDMGFRYEPIRYGITVYNRPYTDIRPILLRR